MKTIQVLCAAVYSFVGLHPAVAQVAPDPTGVGPNNIVSAEYQFPASVDPDILSDRNTELWARVHAPTNLSGPAPLVVFLHGNHATCGMGENPRHDADCTYTDFGTCPDGYVIVPNHNGYAYIADRLASWGYLVVSINANRGINCGASIPGDSGLILARGRLVLKHLQKLSDWNARREPTPDSLGFDLTGQIDFGNVALFGHSRGGEGVRAAYNLYRDTGSIWPARIGPVSFQAIFELAPSDGQSSRILNAVGTVWNVLLPMCDGDLTTLPGLAPFDRMIANRSDMPPTSKSTFTVWGANHNFFNTEWQESDSMGCIGHDPLFPQFPGSPQQQQVGRAAVMALIRANVQGAQGVDPTFNQNFDPLHGLPSVVTDVTRVDRGFEDSPDRMVTERIDDFNNFAPTSSWFVPNDTAGLTMYGHSGMPGHDGAIQRAAVTWWDHAGPDVYFQPNWTAAGSGRDTNIYQTLELRVDRADNALNPPGPTDFSIALGLDDGTLSTPVLLSSYADLRGPVGGIPGGKHLVLQTVRILLSDFGLSSTDRARVRGVRFTFNQTTSGVLFFANVRISTRGGAGAVNFSSPNAAGLLNVNESVSPIRSVVYEPWNSGNRIAVRNVADARGLGQRVGGVEIIVSSDEPFPVRDELVVLDIGGQQFTISRYPQEGQSTNMLIFTLTEAEYNDLPSGSLVRVQYGNDAEVRWEFGPLIK